MKKDKDQESKFLDREQFKPIFAKLDRDLRILKIIEKISIIILLLVLALIIYYK